MNNNGQPLCSCPPRSIFGAFILIDSQNNPRRLVDRFDREVDYLRISLTERCNFRCVYCMPAQGDPFSSNPELLDWDEVARAVTVFAARGVKKIRLTGGEPLVRADVPELIAKLKAIDGIEHVALTSNGFLLPRYARPLAEAGLDSLNLSIDSLDPERFREITRHGTLERVLEGMEAIKKAGVTNIKLNAVVVRDLNDDEVEDLVRFAASQNVILRFIEVMPIGQDTVWGKDGRDACVSARELRQRLGDTWDITPDRARYGAGPARYWRLLGQGLPSGGAIVGIISAVTECFCENCNRLRMTATGGLRACLADDHEIDLREILRSPLSHDDQAHLLSRAIDKSLGEKKERHSFDLEAGGVTFKSMNAIGG